MSYVAVIAILWVYLVVFSATWLILTHFKPKTRAERLRVVIGTVFWFVFWPWVIAMAVIDWIKEGRRYA